MARARPNEEQQPVAGATLQQQLAGDDENQALKLEIEKLRRENAILRMGQPNLTGLSAARGERRLYRVSLKGLRPKKTERVITPKLSAPVHFQSVPPAGYQDLELLVSMAVPDMNRLDEAAWDRFCSEQHDIVEATINGTQTYHLTAAHKKYFDFAPVVGPAVDSLDVPAHSPADAWELFQKLNGILSTVEKPQIEDLGPAPEDAATPAAVLEPAGMV
jgi:hypothetical protein